MSKEDEDKNKGELAWYNELEKEVLKEAEDAYSESDESSLEEEDEEEKKRRLYQRMEADQSKIYRRNDEEGY